MRRPAVRPGRPCPGRRGRGPRRRDPRARSAWRPGWPETRRATGRAARRAPGLPIGTGKAPSRVLDAMWVPSRSQMSSAASRYFSTYGSSRSSWPWRMKATAIDAVGLVGHLGVLGQVGSRRAPWPRRSGREARAAAACSWPEIVRSRSSSSSIRTSSAAPARARPITRAQRRSVSMSSPSMTNEPSSSPCEVGDGPLGASGRAVGPRERQLVVAARLGGHQQLAYAGLPARAELVAARRVGVEVDRRSGVVRDRPDAERVGLRRDVGQHQGDEVGRCHLRVAGHVPRRTPAQRPGQRVVERAGDRSRRWPASARRGGSWRR